MARVHIGAVAFIHRFGSSLNQHVHFNLKFSHVLNLKVRLFCRCSQGRPLIAVFLGLLV
jgi:hypothetical protein